ncbi:MAG TPA: hypothetical protein VLI71_18085 [Gammaproteobacteria bacterium]|nr:hypothetical protein [Gammaproteobacteria bacterium]
MFEIVDLNCVDYQIKAGSIGLGRDGCVFRCTISPVAEDDLRNWVAAVRSGAAIRLVFPEQPLLLERVEVVRMDAARVRIVGHIS